MQVVCQGMRNRKDKSELYFPLARWTRSKWVWYENSWRSTWIQIKRTHALNASFHKWPSIGKKSNLNLSINLKMSIELIFINFSIEKMLYLFSRNYITFKYSLSSKIITFFLDFSNVWKVEQTWFTI